MAGHSLDDKSLRRIGDATRKTELAHARRELHTPSAPTNQTHAARFRMLSPLEQGRQAVGRMLRLERNDDGICYWLATDRQELLHAAAGHQLRWDEGAEVTALWTPAGYSVIYERADGAQRDVAGPRAVRRLLGPSQFQQCAGFDRSRNNAEL